VSFLPDPTERPFAGTYFDGRSAKRHVVDVWRTSQGLLIRGETVGELRWPYPEMRRDERISPDEPVRYERGPVESAEVLVVPGAGFLPELRGASGGIGQLRRRSIGSLILPALVALGALVGAWFLALPPLAARLASRVPTEWEQKLGATAVQTFTETHGVCTDPAQVAALDRLTARLTADGSGGPYTYQIRIIEDPLVNAMAAPGGQILVFRGLINDAESPEELAGVLAHEIEHVVQRHGVEAILREMPAQLLVSGIMGSSPLGGNVAQIAYSLGAASYQRNDEREADAGAVRRLAAAGISSKGMIDFFRRSAAEGEEGGLLQYLSSHPASTERMAALEALSRDLPPARNAAFTAEEWTALRAGCGYSAP
jgi:predicted Zn-dependent protease